MIGDRRVPFWISATKSPKHARAMPTKRILSNGDNSPPPGNADLTTNLRNTSFARNLTQMCGDKSAIWWQAHADAHLVREALVRGHKLAQSDKVASIACVNESLAALANLRSRAPQASALLAIMLFYGIELEVRLSGLDQVPLSTLAITIAEELHRCDQLIAAITDHLN
jgi:hypothetical protein